MDDVFMRRALELAERGIGLVSPNPLVGAVVVRADEVVGEGWHEGPGRPHAEILALETAGDRAEGATLYVSLEPCSHFGRTPPCVPRVAEAGITRVVAALRDPNPQVDGQGISRLREAGIEVSVGLLAEEAGRQNAAFLKHVRTGFPHVVLKMAASLDGKVAARDGSSRWITGEPARAEVHRMRAAADAILVGAGTAVRDDPSLTVRDSSFRGRPPLRVIVDGRGAAPPSLSVFADGQAPTLVATTEEAPSSRQEEWRRAGAEVVVLDAEPGTARVPLPALFRDLGKRDVQGVLVEGGPTVAWEAVRTGMVDEVVVFVAPLLVGGRQAPSVLEGEGIGTLAQAHRLDILDVERIGDDLKVVARVHRDR